MEGHNSLTTSTLIPSNGILNGAIIIRLPIVPRVMRRVVLHIEALHQGTLANFGLEFLVVVVGLSRKNVLSVSV